jgi:hypothetical protein
MENYVRFSSSSPPASTSAAGGNNNHHHSPGPFVHHSPSTGSEGYLDSPLPPRRGSRDNAAGGSGSGSSWSFAPLASLQRVWQRWCGAAQQQDAYRSGYLTLVPLSGVPDTCGCGSVGVSGSPRCIQCFVMSPCTQRIHQHHTRGAACALLPPTAAADSRLKPRRTKLIVSTLVSASCCV